MKAELDIKPFLKATNEFGIAEPQPCGVQVVEWVGLVGNFSILSSEHIPEENNKVNNPQSDNIPRRIIHNHR